MLKNLDEDYFKRSTEADKAGLKVAIALPVFAGERLMAVVVFFCGDDEDSVGVLELWAGKESHNVMILRNGYYGALERFEWISS